MHDEPGLVLNEHVTEHDEVCAVLRALCIACCSGADGAPCQEGHEW
jgi:hypothetical protein